MSFPPAEDQTPALRRPLSELESLSTAELFKFLGSCFPLAELEAVSTILASREATVDARNSNLEANLAESESKRAAVATELAKSRIIVSEGLGADLVKYKNQCSELEERNERLVKEFSDDISEHVKKVVELEEILPSFYQVIKNQRRLRLELQECKRKNAELEEINRRLKDEVSGLRDFKEKLQEFVEFMRETKICENGNDSSVKKNGDSSGNIPELKKKKCRGSEDYESSEDLIPLKQLKKKKLVKMVIGSTASSNASSKNLQRSSKDLRLMKSGRLSKDSDNANECLDGPHLNSSDSKSMKWGVETGRVVRNEGVSGNPLKGNTQRWTDKYELVTSLANDCALCLQAVCTIYRRRRFSLFGEERAIKMAEFLTDSDPNGRLKKTVDELDKQDADGVGFCQGLAIRHAKQLFEIYTNKEDPYFPS